jgi:hypothetical protein
MNLLVLQIPTSVSTEEKCQPDRFLNRRVQSEGASTAVAKKKVSVWVQGSKA